MTRVFLQILNLSLNGSVAVLIVLILRWFLRKTPKIFSLFLWGMVLVRFLIPFTFSSPWSLMPKSSPLPAELAFSGDPQDWHVDSGLRFVDKAVNPVLQEVPPAAMNSSLNLLAGIWAGGLFLILAASGGSWLRLRRQLKNAAEAESGVLISTAVESPFVLGLFRPKIVLPAALPETDLALILQHERTHIRRGDPWLRMAGFLITIVHWFNPLAWLSFLLAGQDMEMSCDELVIRTRGPQVKKEYSSLLLKLASGRRVVSSPVLSFGGGEPQKRICHVLNYRKSKGWKCWASLTAVVLCGLLVWICPPVLKLQEGLWTAELSAAQKAELREIYDLELNSEIIKTEIRLPESIQSYSYRVELWQSGVFQSAVVENYGGTEIREGFLITAFSISRNEAGQWSSLRWTSSFLNGGYCTSPAVPFPDHFVPSGMAVTTLNGQKNQLPQSVIADQPLIIAAVGFHTAEEGGIQAYTPEAIMENPSLIQSQECLYLVRVLFSEQSAETWKPQWS